MFIELKHNILPSPLRAVVSSDGMYFPIAIDVGRILGFVDTYAFAKKRTKLTIKDVIHKKTPIRPRVQKLKILTMDETLKLFELNPKKKKLAAAFLGQRWKCIHVKNPYMPVSMNFKKPASFEVLDSGFLFQIPENKINDFQSLNFTMNYYASKTQEAYYSLPLEDEPFIPTTEETMDVFPEPHLKVDDSTQTMEPPLKVDVFSQTMEPHLKVDDSTQTMEPNLKVNGFSQTMEPHLKVDDSTQTMEPPLKVNGFKKIHQSTMSNSSQTDIFSKPKINVSPQQRNIHSIPSNVIPQPRKILPKPSNDIFQLTNNVFPQKRTILFKPKTNISTLTTIYVSTPAVITMYYGPK